MEPENKLSSGASGYKGLPQLQLDFSGRVIEHLGIQMYQSHVDAIAEMIANAWDADAAKVEISLPLEINDSAQIVVKDDGVGMTLKDVQDKYLKVGYDRRRGSPDARTGKLKRPVLGRKGIGKFAGFGIARQVVVTTISEETGELTEFSLDYDRIRENPDDRVINVSRYEGPGDENSKKRRAEGDHGTTVVLKRLDRKRNFDPEKFRRGIARRFLLWQKYSDFEITVNGRRVSDVDPADLDQLSYELPKNMNDIEKSKRSYVIITDDGWVVERVGDHEVRWRVRVYKNPIEEELQGFTVFAHGKMAQKTPFFFGIGKGISFQHGLVYMSGDIEADFIDELEEDVIATERQRVNWSHESLVGLKEWGQELVKFVAWSWGHRRQENKLKIVREDERIKSRLGKLSESERRVVEGAIGKIANFPDIDDPTFVDIASSMITAWEQGRLRKLIEDVSESENLDESSFLSLLMEANALTALNVLEAVATKLEVVKALEAKVRAAELENSIRDYIYKNPWIIDPTWEGFVKEKALKTIVSDVAEKSGMASSGLWDKRVDLVLRSGDTLAVLEFVRPKNAKLDLDHVSRFEYYVEALRDRLSMPGGGEPIDGRIPIRRIIGYLISDMPSRDPAIKRMLNKLADNDMYFKTWERLISDAKRDLMEYAEALGERAEDDERVREILARLSGR